MGRAVWKVSEKLKLDPDVLSEGRRIDDVQFLKFKTTFAGDRGFFRRNDRNPRHVRTPILC